MGVFRGARSHLGLLLILAVALGGLFFLFELFEGLTDDNPKVLLSTNDVSNTSAGIPSGAGFIGVVLPTVIILLGVGALLLLKRRLENPERRRWATSLLGGLSVGLLGVGVYLAISTIFRGGLPFGGVDYGEHTVETEGVTPLGLTLLAAFVVSVGVVAVSKPKLLPIPLLAWLVAGVVFGMFGSNAIYGVNLFKHHSVVEAKPDYTEAVNVYWKPGAGGSGGDGQGDPSGLLVLPNESGLPEQPLSLADLVYLLTHGTPDQRAEAVHGLANLDDPAVIPHLLEALGDIDEDVRTAAELALMEALGGDVPDVRDAVESGLVEALGDEDPEVKDAAESILLEALQDDSHGAKEAAESALAQALGDSNPEVKDAAEGVLEETGASMTPLENAGALVYLGDKTFWAPGTSADTVSMPEVKPVFEVRGASATGYLRTDVGDVYTGNGWSRLDPVELDYAARTPTRQLVHAVLIESGDVDIFPWEDAGAALLPWPDTGADESHSQRLTISPHEAGTSVPVGTLPISMGADFFDTDGSYWPFSGTFSINEELNEYAWSSNEHLFSEEVLLGAQARTDASVLALPDTVTQRVRLLAEEVTEPYESAYEKARALAWYLRANYQYEFTLEDATPRPDGRDAVDWFLFDSQKGTCGEFSSAFVVMARSVGIPARVVSGWVISEGVERQVVQTDQAHQWAEVAFEGLGWRRFDPTPFNGAPFRAGVLEAWADERDRLANKLDAGPREEDRLEAINELLEFSEVAPDEVTDVSESLIKALMDDQAAAVRAKAAQSTGDEGYQNAIDALVTALHGDESEDVRAAAAEALAKLGGDDAIDAFIKALQEDESEVVRGF